VTYNVKYYNERVFLRINGWSECLCECNGQACSQQPYSNTGRLPN